MFPEAKGSAVMSSSQMLSYVSKSKDRMRPLKNEGGAGSDSNVATRVMFSRNFGIKAVIGTDLQDYVPCVGPNYHFYHKLIRLTGYRTSWFQKRLTCSRGIAPALMLYGHQQSPNYHSIVSKNKK